MLLPILLSPNLKIWTFRIRYLLLLVLFVWRRAILSNAKYRWHGLPSKFHDSRPIPYENTLHASPYKGVLPSDIARTASSVNRVSLFAIVVLHANSAELSQHDFSGGSYSTSSPFGETQSEMREEFWAKCCNCIPFIDWRRVRWAGHVARMGVIKYACKNFSRKTWREPVGVDGRMLVQQILKTSVSYWIQLAQNREGWRTLVNTVINLFVAEKARNFLTSSVTISFWRRILL
jgi:hypothetical protein